MKSYYSNKMTAWNKVAAAYFILITALFSMILASCATTSPTAVVVVKAEIKKEIEIPKPEKPKKKITQESPPYILLYNKGVALFNAAKLDKSSFEPARDAFEASLKEKEGFWPSLYNLAYISFLKHNYEEADRDIKAAVVFGKNKRTELLAAIISMEKGDKDKAYLQFSEIIKNYSRNEYAYAMLGNLEMEKDKCEEAIKYYDKSGKLTKQRYQVFINKGSCYLKLASYKEAVKTFESVYSMEIKEPYMLAQYAFSLRKMGDVKKSAEIYKELIERYPDEISAYKNLGIIYDIYLDNPEQAVNYYKLYIEKNGSDSGAVSNWKNIAEQKLKRWFK